MGGGWRRDRTPARGHAHGHGPASRHRSGRCRRASDGPCAGGAAAVRRSDSESIRRDGNRADGAAIALQSPAVTSPPSVRTRRIATALPLARMRRRPARRMRSNRPAAVSQPRRRWCCAAAAAAAAVLCMRRRCRRPATSSPPPLSLPPPHRSLSLPPSLPPPSLKKSTRRPPAGGRPQGRRPCFGGCRRARTAARGRGRRGGIAVLDAPDVRAPQNDAPAGKVLASPAPFGARRLAGRDACAAVQGGASMERATAGDRAQCPARTRRA